MRGFEYEYLLRPNYEAIAASSWVVGGLANFFLPDVLHLNLPRFPLLVMSGVCGGMALLRGYMAYRRFIFSRKLYHTPIDFISWKKLYTKTQKKPDEVWLGFGFPWTQQEIQQAFDILKNLDARLMQKSKGHWVHGIGAKEEKDVFCSIKNLKGHTLIVGTTGAGKTRLFDLLVSQAIYRNEAVVIIDPKGDHELRDNAKKACERMGRPDKFVFFHPAYPDKSVRLDPLKNWNRSTEPASRIAALIPSETKADPFTAFGWMALNSIAQGFLFLEEQPTLVKLRRYVEGDPSVLVEKALRKYFEQHITNWEKRVNPYVKKFKNQTLLGYIEFYNKEAKEEKPMPSIDGLVTSYTHNREHFHKMIASLIPILNMLTVGDLGALLSPDFGDENDPRDITNLNRVIEKKQVIYIGLDSLSDSTVGSALGSILLADLAAIAGARYNYKQTDQITPVNVFVDEAAEILNDPTIQLLNKGRGAGFRVTIATQTLADLEVRTGSEAGARQALGNTNNWIFLRVTDSETQKYIAEAMPKTSIKTIEQGYRSAAKSDDPLGFTGTYTESLKETETELFPSAILGLLPDLHYFAKFADGTFWKGKLPILLYGGKESAKKERKF